MAGHLKLDHKNIEYKIFSHLSLVNAVYKTTTNNRSF